MRRDVQERGVLLFPSAPMRPPGIVASFGIPVQERCKEPGKESVEGYKMVNPAQMMIYWRNVD